MAPDPTVARNHFAGPADFIDADFDRIAGNVAAQRLPSVCIVELRVQLHRCRADCIAAERQAAQLLHHRVHGFDVGALRLLRVPRTRLRVDRDPGTVGGPLDLRFTGGHHHRKIEFGLLRGRGCAEEQNRERDDSCWSHNYLQINRVSFRAMRAHIALIGYGNVARRFERMLDEQRELLARDHGLSCDIVATATRHGCMAGGAPCEDAFAAIRYVAESKADLRVVIEVTTLNVVDGEPAISHIRAAIERGCHVVTANKGPVAFAYETLRDAATKAGVAFLFEGAVMDGVPVFNMVRETMPAVRSRVSKESINTHDEPHPDVAWNDGVEFDAGAWRRCRRTASRKPTRRWMSTAGTRRRRPRRSPTC